MRELSGQIVLPADAPLSRAARVIVEVRDVSLADAPAPIVAKHELANFCLRPGALIPFKFTVPEVDPNRALALRVHVSMDGSDAVKPGDLLTMESYPLPSEGPIPFCTVQVRVVS